MSQNRNLSITFPLGVLKELVSKVKDANEMLSIESNTESIDCTMTQSLLEDLYDLGIEDMNITMTVNGSIVDGTLLNNVIS